MYQPSHELHISANSVTDPLACRTRRTGPAEGAGGGEAAGAGGCTGAGGDGGAGGPRVIKLFLS